MKRIDLERILIQRGYVLKRETKHRIWANGTHTIAVPRSKELPGGLCNRLLRSIDNNIPMKPHERGVYEKH